MRSLIASSEFRRRYNELPETVKDRLDKQKELLTTDIRHPSLHVEKLAPKSKNMWSFRIDIHYRVLFQVLDNGDLFLLTVGTHDWVYRRI